MLLKQVTGPAKGQREHAEKHFQKYFVPGKKSLKDQQLASRARFLSRHTTQENLLNGV
jgi:hypothetical protein